MRSNRTQRFHTFEGVRMPVISGGDGDDDVLNTDSGIIIGADPPKRVNRGNNGNGNSGGLSQADVDAAVAAALEAERQRISPELAGLRSTLDEQNAWITSQREAAQAAEDNARAEREAEEARIRAEQEAAMDPRTLMDAREQEWQERFSSLEQRESARDAAMAQEQQYNAAMEYRRQALARAEDEILPELHDLVTGLTQEEVDAQIALLTERSATIMQNVMSTVQQPQQFSPTRPFGLGGATGAPPVGVIESQDAAQRQLTPADIKNMSLADYAKQRGKIMESLFSDVNRTGPYGRR